MKIEDFSIHAVTAHGGRNVLAAFVIWKLLHEVPSPSFEFEEPSCIDAVVLDHELRQHLPVPASRAISSWARTIANRGEVGSLRIEVEIELCHSINEWRRSGLAVVEAHLPFLHFTIALYHNFALKSTHFAFDGRKINVDLGDPLGFGRWAGQKVLAQVREAKRRLIGEGGRGWRIEDIG